jgi:hypothetical protein
MIMDRRTFLQLGIGAACCRAVWGRRGAARLESAAAPPPPAFSVIPVVGDGKWIWTKPPQGEMGYLEPRPYRLEVGIEIRGRGNARQIQATTPLPVPCPEQQLDDEQIQAQGCEAEIQEVGPYARQLFLAAPQIAEGQVATAVARYRLTLRKQYHGYRSDLFPAEQTAPADVRKTYLGDSPGIQTRTAEVRKLLDELRGDTKHPWDLAHKFAEWIPLNIKPQMGRYTSVTEALVHRVGDCEEMAAVFVALCRAAGIPARLVWVPNHNWAEFYLADKEGRGHWIPAHTAAYFWFGWTGVHELVLQKGDRIRVPERGGAFRLLQDWMQWGGRRPEVRYLAKLLPEAGPGSSDAGPGAREKATTGEWRALGTHPLDRYARR